MTDDLGIIGLATLEFKRREIVFENVKAVIAESARVIALFESLEPSILAEERLADRIVFNNAALVDMSQLGSLIADSSRERLKMAYARMAMETAINHLNAYAGDDIWKFANDAMRQVADAAAQLDALINLATVLRECNYFLKYYENIHDDPNVRDDDGGRPPIDDEQLRG